jgi:hypothetical protein
VLEAIEKASDFRGLFHVMPQTMGSYEKPLYNAISTKNEGSAGLGGRIVWPPGKVFWPGG